MVCQFKRYYAPVADDLKIQVAYNGKHLSVVLQVHVSRHLACLCRALSKAAMVTKALAASQAQAHSPRCLSVQDGSSRLTFGSQSQCLIF